MFSVDSTAKPPFARISFAAPETAAMMDRFYAGILRKRNPESPAEALRSAQLAQLARNRSSLGTGAPWSWAGFVVSGQ